VLNKLYTVLII